MSDSSHLVPATGHLSTDVADRVPALTPDSVALAALLDGLDLPRNTEQTPRRRGRPRSDRSGIARSLVARALLDLPTVTVLVKQLHRDPGLRQACGWRKPGDIPSCSTFCRLAPEIVRQLPEPLRSRIADYHPDNPMRVPANLPAVPLDPEVEQNLPMLTQLRDLFVVLVRQNQADLSLRQLSTILACYLADGPLTMRSLQQRLGLDPMALKHALDRLERLRFTRATRDRHNRRRFLVHRTRHATEFLNLLFASTPRQATHDGGEHAGRKPMEPASASSGL